jgi:cell division protein FtsQ
MSTQRQATRTQTARRRTSRSTRSTQSTRSGVQTASPYRLARRRRAMAQQMRRMEAALSGLPDRLRANRAAQAAARLTGSGWQISKLLSILILAGAIYILGMIHTEDGWFVYAEDVAFANLIRLQPADLYAAGEIEGMNIFWLQPQELRRKLLQNHWIDDVRVRVGLPASVTVEVQEMQPVALWVANTGRYWLASNGATLPAVDEGEGAGELASGLPQIVDSLLEARDITVQDRLAMDPQVLASALTLVEALPELEGKVRYNRDVGLNFPLPKPAVWVYWGDGFHMDEKRINLAATLDLVRASETPAQIVDIRLIDRPFVR